MLSFTDKLHSSVFQLVGNSYCSICLANLDGSSSTYEELPPLSVVVPMGRPCDALNPASMMVPTGHPCEALNPALRVVPTGCPVVTLKPSEIVVPIGRAVDILTL